MEKDYVKRGRLMKQIKELVETTFPENIEQQELVYHHIHLNFIVRNDRRLFYWEKY